MAQSSLPQPGNRITNATYVDAGPYTGDQWATLFRLLFTGDQQATQGVLRSVWNELAVTNPLGLQVQVDTGAGIANGHVFVNDTAAVTIDVDGGANRSDAVCIVENNTNAAIAAGPATNYNTPGNASIPPYSARLVVVKNVLANFSQTLARYMVRLATFTTGAVSISGLTDVRAFCEFSSVPLDNTVSLAKMANDAVDDTKAGNRVPQFYRRQGDSATDWSDYGGTTYIPSMVRMQAGASSVSWNGMTNTRQDVVTFPVAFSNVPLVYAICHTDGEPVHATVSVMTISATQARFLIRYWGTSYDGVAFVGAVTEYFWFAVGPE